MEAKNFDKIEAYLAGEMSEAEAKADSTLAEDIEVHQIAHNAMEILVEDDLRNQFKAWQSEETTAAPSSATESKVVSMSPKATSRTARTTSQPAKRRSLFPRLAAAASVALLLGFFTFQYSNNSSSIDGSYTEYMMPTSVRSADGAATTPLATGLEAYAATDYAKAIEVYKTIPTTNERYNEAQYYLAHSYYKNNNFSEAIAQFGKVTKAGDARYKEQAEWYQLLSFVANKQQDASFDALLNKLLTDGKHSYHAKAQELNSDLNSWW